MNKISLETLKDLGYTIMNCVLPFFFQLIVNKINKKILSNQAALEKKIDSFKSAIQYILNLCTISNMRKNNKIFPKDLTEIKKEKLVELKKAEQLNKDNDEFYSKFYYIFQMFISEAIADEYNNLRNNAMNGEISHEDTYKKLCVILNFKIKDIVM